jgi:hypothetical protein
MTHRQTIGFNPPKVLVMIAASLLLWLLLWALTSWMLQ